MKDQNNVVLITGGTSGIGLTLMKRFIAEGNKVIITGRNLTKLNELKASHQNLDIFCGDLSEANVIDDLVNFIQSKFSNLNILINNAGVQFNYHFISEKEVEQKIKYEIATNFIAPILLNTKLLPILKKNSESSIVNVSSGLFLAPKESASVYCATKSALHTYTKTCAIS